MLDVDGFKTYNDTYGHLAGDRVLQTIARALQAAVRQSDITFRYGGDEFSLILTNTTAVAAEAVVERAREHVTSTLSASGIVILGLSAGITMLVPDGRDAQELVDRADKALYQSKARGGTIIIEAG